MSINLIYITCPNEAEAQRIAQHLLEMRLVACANIFPIQSLYWWEGNLCNESESVLLVKTRPDLWEAVKEAVEAIHPYQVPCIVKIVADANERYQNWIKNETGLN